MSRASVLWVFLLHLALLTGVQRTEDLGTRLAAYPAQLAGVLRPEVLAQVAPLTLLTATTLAGGLLLAWALAGPLSRWPRAALWLLEGLPAALLLLLGVWAGLMLSLSRGWTFPLTPWAPLMLVLTVCALALPTAAHSALGTRQARQDALRADHTRTARAMGLPESSVRRRAERLAQPERAAGLAGEAMTLVLALVVMEGLLAFPGLGNEVYRALQAGLFPPGAGELAADDRLFRAQVLSTALLALLLLGALGAAALHTLAARLDPRARSGAEAA